MDRDRSAYRHAIVKCESGVVVGGMVCEVWSVGLVLWTGIRLRNGMPMRSVGAMDRDTRHVNVQRESGAIVGGDRSGPVHRPLEPEAVGMKTEAGPVATAQGRGAFTALHLASAMLPSSSKPGVSKMALI